MRNLIGILALLSLVSSVVVFAAEKTAGKVALIECTFPNKGKEQSTPQKITVVADLSKGTANVVQVWNDGDDNGNRNFSILTHARASDAKDRETLKLFSEIETSTDYKAPSTLVLAANNGDDTDQTIVIQYQRGFSTLADYKRM